MLCLIIVTASTPRASSLQRNQWQVIEGIDYAAPREQNESMREHGELGEGVAGRANGRKGICP